jgi:P-type Cu+ transporter
MMNAEKDTYPDQSAGPNVGVTDPVCGTAIVSDKDALNYEYQGNVYYFCSKHCLARFKDDSARFSGEKSLQGSEAGQEKPLLGRPFTCPAHKGVLQDCPGRCYQCGSVLIRMPPFF